MPLVVAESIITDTATAMSCLNLSKKLSVNDISVSGKRVILRVDYNVPLSKDGKQVTNNQRIIATLSTIKLLQEKRAKSIIIMSHLGRPNGERVESMSLKPIAEELGKLTGQTVHFVKDCIGDEVEQTCSEASDGALVLLENLRFHIEEEGSSCTADGIKKKADMERVKEFRMALTRLGDIYVNDAFGTVHRAHSSIVGIDLPLKVAGLLVEKELAYFSKVLESPDGIDLAILGGSKVSDKIQLVKNLLPKIKKLVIGGGMCFTFLKVLKGMDIGKSLYDQAGAEIVPEIKKEAERLGVQLILPNDFITGDSISETAKVENANVKDGIPAGMIGLDFGPNSIEELVKTIKSAKSILWNGPVGVFEISHFAKGTKAIVETLVEITSKGALTIVGGGDSGAAVAKWNAETKLSHVSTGGGASLELLEGHQLPGILALTDRSD